MIIISVIIASEIPHEANEILIVLDNLKFFVHKLNFLYFAEYELVCNVLMKG